VIAITQRDGQVMFAVRLQPRAREDGVRGEHAGALKIRVTAPALESRANQALRELLAERLNVPVSAVRIVAGEKSRDKQLAVAGVSAAQIEALAREGGPK
jgi:uncharacterized protein